MWSSSRTVTLACVIGALILGSGVLLTATAADKPDAEEKARERVLSPAQKEIVKAIEAYNRAIANKDLEGSMAAFVPGDDTMVLGTGPGEHWRGPEEIRYAHENFFKSFDKETTTPVWREITVVGDVAWMAAQSHFEDEFKGEKNEFLMNVSGVFRKEHGKWRIALLHISNLTGQEKEEE